MSKSSRTFIPIFVVTIMVALTAWVGYRQMAMAMLPTVDITIIYSPESEPYMPEMIHSFNESFANGINPLTGQSLSQSDRRLFVSGRSGSSGVVQQGIVNAMIAPNNSNVERPTLFAPSTSIWLDLVNHATGREIFRQSEAKATAYSAVIIAIWESRLKAIQAKSGKTEIGWQELLDVMHSPNGWHDYGISGRKQVYYGHTDPYISSTGLATLLAEFAASERYHNQENGNQSLSIATINDEEVQAGVRSIEQMIKHYSERTTEMREAIAQGPDYVDFIALQEDALLYINMGSSGFTPPEKLVALYPKEGTYWFDHPFAIPNVEWVSQEQRAAAQLFTDYVLSETVQKLVMEQGLMRPVNPAVTLAYPYVSELGIDPAQALENALIAPPPSAITAVQASWQYVKKQADLLLLFDVSGSMEGDKIAKAKMAAKAFLDKLAPQNRVAIATLSDTTQWLTPFTKLEGSANRVILDNAINNLSPTGGTALYDGILAGKDIMQEAESQRIRAIVLLTDGQDTDSQHSLNDVLSMDRGAGNPLLIFPIAYGGDADIGVLNNIARISSTKILSGEPENIEALFKLLGSFF